VPRPVVRPRTLSPRLCCLITEPYLGGAGSFHPPAEYLGLLHSFCRENDMVFILDEVQANFGRTGELFAFESYGIEPDIVVLGKGLGNGAPVSAAVGRADVLGSLHYGEGSDTYSANPYCCAAVLATLDLFEANDILGHARRISKVIEAGLLRLKELPLVRHVRGEGLVWGVEMCEHAGRAADAIANECVRSCYLGEPDGDGIHLLGPLASCVLRVAPPLVITEREARESLELLFRLLAGVAEPVAAPARAPAEPVLAPA
jgi:4-aminobutyrate aminotransferase-like enzyme